MKKYFYLLATLVLVLLGVQSAQAQVLPAPVELEGFAWSSTVGWISLNCKTGSRTAGDICTTSNYRVTIQTNGNITGWGWSSNIGWVKFGGLSSFPTGGGTQAVNASVSGTFPNLTWRGWARACAGTNAPAASEQKDCSSMNPNDNSGDWDGWISLGGTTGAGGTYRISADMTAGMNNNSYAWGSDVVGWVDMFSQVDFTPIDVPTSTPITATGTGCTILSGASTCTGRLTWTLPATTTNPNIYRFSPSPAEVSQALSRTDFAVTLTRATTTFQVRSGATTLRTVRLRADCAAGLTYNGTICTSAPVVTPVPTVELFKAAPPIVRSGNTSLIEWRLSAFPPGTSCTITGPGLNADVNALSGSVRTGALRNTSTVTMRCTGAFDGEVTAETRIEVIPVAEEV